MDALRTVIPLAEARCSDFAQCLLEGQDARGGTMQSMLESNCKAQLTVERTEALHQVIDER